MTRNANFSLILENTALSFFSSPAVGLMDGETIAGYIGKYRVYMDFQRFSYFVAFVSLYVHSNTNCTVCIVHSYEVLYDFMRSEMFCSCFIYTR